MRDKFESEKRLDEPSDTIGKTVERIVGGLEQQTLLTVFTDGTFLYQVARYQYEDSTIEYDCFMSKDVAFNFGLISDDEHKAYKAEKEAAEKARKDEADRKQFEALKAKFERTNS